MNVSIDQVNRVMMPLSKLVKHALLANCGGACHLPESGAPAG
jgi:hypothetical protein